MVNRLALANFGAGRNDKSNDNHSDTSGYAYDPFSDGGGEEVGDGEGDHDAHEQDGPNFCPDR